MKAQITSAFRIREGEASRKYSPGDVAEGASAEWAVANGYGSAIDEDKAAPAPANKAKKPPRNK